MPRLKDFFNNPKKYWGEKLLNAAIKVGDEYNEGNIISILKKNPDASVSDYSYQWGNMVEYNTFWALTAYARHAPLEMLVDKLNAGDITSDQTKIQRFYQQALRTAVTATPHPDVKILTILMKKPDIDLNHAWQDSAIFSKTLLNAAIENKSNDVFDMLFNDPRININTPDLDGNTALMTATLSQNKHAFDKLLNHPNIQMLQTNNRGQDIFERAMYIADHYKNDYFLKALENKKDKILNPRGKTHRNLPRKRAVFKTNKKGL